MNLDTTTTRLPTPDRPAASPAPPSDAEIARVAKALGHPARVAIVRFLAARRACYCGAIVQELPLAQATVSQHLRELKAAGLIQGTVEGNRVCYCLDPATLARFGPAFAALFESLTRGALPADNCEPNDCEPKDCEPNEADCCS